ncbi:hypothetical protein B7R22_02000 [Subtercola boreus]|uniref:Nitroreductase domain-containing protein n=1 Tax=Subtercola boreus TaxID=120213 RepID=A0A3E0W553_9MICO|nr:hypothetical protein [Subtercola boreus]RFA16915.1 hypothetical protein B7R22_02000 [Subtercola boreus]
MKTNKTHRGRRITLITIGSVVGVAALGLGVVLTVGGIFVPANYLEPWSSSYADTFSDVRMKVVAQAELAPSGHNMQPWTVELDPADANVLYLYTDPGRLTLAVDPLARQTMVSQGTFLQYLKVSAANLGYTADVTLFPNGTYNETDLEASMNALPVAEVSLTKDPSASTADYASLFLSDTNRAPYTDAQLTTDQISTLSGLATDTTTSLKLYTDETDVKVFNDFGVQGTLIETQYQAATAESDRLFYATEGAKNVARSGFAVEGQGTTGFMKYLLQGLITIIPSINDDASGAKNAIALTDAAVEHTPAYGMISTPANTRMEQVKAGILYADVSLRARTLGLVMQPLSQVLQEYPTMAAPYAAIHDAYAPEGQTIQMLVRIGTPTTQYPNTMRRDANTFLRTP